MGTTPFPELSTPSLLLEHPVLLRNLAGMRRRAECLGVRLRPHLKTAKCAEIARLAHTGEGLTVSTLAEAEYFFAAGFADLTYAVSMLPARLERTAALLRRGARLQVLTDDPGVAQAIAAASSRLEQDFEVLVELDCGGRRGGVQPDGPELLRVARILHEAPGVSLAGVLTHAGQSYHCSSVAAVREVARCERDAVLRAAARLEAAGLPCPLRSVGSTPTATHAENLEGVDELRPGVYMFHDLDQLALGSCGASDLALTVLSSVIGHNRSAGRILLDAGALALSKDRSADALQPGSGYGVVCSPLPCAPLGLCVRHVEQEHGIVEVPDPAWFERLPIGSRVRIQPQHACLTAAAFPRYAVVEGSKLRDLWQRTGGWD